MSKFNWFLIWARDNVFNIIGISFFIGISIYNFCLVSYERDLAKENREILLEIRDATFSFEEFSESVFDPDKSGPDNTDLTTTCSKADREFVLNDATHDMINGIIVKIPKQSLALASVG